MATSVTIAAGPNLGDTNVVFTFDGDYPTGQFVDGSWWVVGGAGRHVTAISPTCVTTASGTFQDNSATYSNRTINGATINPGNAVDAIGVIPQTANPNVGRYAQGYDSLLSAPGYEQSQILYDVRLNADPGVAGPISLAVPISIVKAVSIATPLQTCRPALSDLVVLTVLAAVPPANAFRPAVATADKSILHTEDQIRYDILPGLDRTKITTLPTLDVALSTIQRYCQMGYTNLLSCRNIYAYNASGPPYGQFYSRLWDAAYISLCMNYTPAQLRSLYIAILQLGIEAIGCVGEGWVFPDTGGALMVKFPVVLAALNFPSATNLRIADAQRCRSFLEDRQVFSVTTANTAVPSPYQPQYATNNGALGYKVDDILTDASAVLDGNSRGMAIVVNVCSNGVIGNSAAGKPETPGTGGLAPLTATTKTSTGKLAAPPGTVFPVGDYLAAPITNVPYSGGSGSGLLLTFPRHFNRYGQNHVDTPDWAASYTTHGTIEGSNWDTSYRDICSYAFTGSALAAHLITGAKAAWNNPAWFEYIDRAWDMVQAPDTVNFVAKGNGPTQLQADAWYAYYGGPSGPTARLIEARASGINAWLKYDYCLSRRTPPPLSCFTVTETIHGVRTAHNIIDVEIYGRAITLETDTTFGVGNPIEVTYRPASGSQIKDLRGNVLGPVVAGFLTGRGGVRQYARGWL